ncbi:MAG: hypothetical protein NUW02_02330 [Candidatus Campbellbacteria bacterium]|nr:hypothetical protein [Candidatus Campbellbacteria bacterium]
MFRRFTSERVRKLRRKRFVVFSVIYTLLVFSLFLFLWQLSYANFLQINNVSIEGAKTVARADVFGAVSDTLTGAYGHIFSKRNIFLYPRAEIQKSILTRFPILKKVSIGVENGHKLAIHLEERKGVAVVCQLVGDVPTPTTEECYFIDDTAFVFITAPHFSGTSYITYELNMMAVPLGTYALTLEEFSLFRSLITALGKLSMRVTHLRIEGNDIEVSLTTPHRDTLRLLVKRSNSYDEVLTNLTTIIESDDFKKAGGIMGVEYIDLRFGNKVFYKEKEHKEQAPSLLEVTPELQSL